MTKKTNKTPRTKPVIPLEHSLPEIFDRKAWEIPTCYLEKDGKGGYKRIEKRRQSKTLLVNNIRNEVDAWRKSGYITPRGITVTSKRLLEFWFEQDHIVNKELFRFRFAQREAIETTIYLYEVKDVKDNALLAEMYLDEFALADDLVFDKKTLLNEIRKSRKLYRKNPTNNQTVVQELPPDDLTRYCVKAATGSGKTFVMSFLAVWSYCNRKYERNTNLSKTILIIAPNVIVYERLRLDFENGKVFNEFPFIPEELRHDWQMSFIMRDDQVKTSTDGTLYLTNIHQIYETREERVEDLGPVGNILGHKPQKDSTASWLTSIFERIKGHDELLIINDEAHHVHDEELAWYKSIINFHESLKEKGGKGLSLLFDLTATPKDQNGTFFPWIITDYPLAQAIEDRIVKTPLIVHQSNKKSPDNKKISNAYNAYNEWIQIALNRYKEHEEFYGKLRLKPVLFVMAEDTKQADQIAEGMQKLAGFNKKDQILVIHTNKDGTLSKNEKKLDEVREASRKIDEPNSKVKVVVSVLMLREGWDVKNVSIILGLRPFTSKANILPEQAVGRGLRIMPKIGPDYTQILEIIGTDKFEEFVKQLEQEGVGIGVTHTKPTEGYFITPLKTREKYNIKIPVLSSSFARVTKGIDDFDPANLPAIGELDTKGNFKQFKVFLIDASTEKRVSTKQITIEDDDFVTSQELLASITNKIIRDGKFGPKFNQICKIVKKYVKKYCFSKEVDLESMAVRRTLATADISNKIMLVIARKLGEHIKIETEMKLVNYPISLIELDGFFWKRDTTECKKTVFNYTPVYNELEKEFAKFLEKSKDINKFCALAETFTRFSIYYLNMKGGQSLYYPDFVAQQQEKSGSITLWIIETKGYEDENVELKDAEAQKWCRKASEFTKTEWKFIKVPDKFFRGQNKKYNDFKDMIDNLKKYSVDNQINLF